MVTYGFRIVPRILGDGEPVRGGLVKPPATWIVVLAVLPLAAWLRFADLGRATVRADEITLLEQVARGQSVLDLWRNPPWMNQIPFVDTFTMIWNGLRPGPPDERTVREPYAILGTLTVIGVAAWLSRRRGLAAAMLVGVWMSLLPYHLYQSREAYYYVAAMALAGGMTLQTVDMLVRLRDGEVPSLTAYAAWTAWAVGTCLTHMSTWVVALACWDLLLATGFRSVLKPRRRRHIGLMAAAAAVIGLVMQRWVWRAVAEALNPMQGGGHIGLPFAWVAPRVLPFFTAGDNAFGVVASATILAAGVWAVTKNRRMPPPARDAVYNALTLVTITGLLAAYAYVGAVGGGKGKITYFSAVLPVFLAWSAYTLDIVAAGLPRTLPAIVRVALPCAALLVLAKPAWMVTRLDGKATPYRKLVEWLDANLDPGSVVVVDRWFEPWNEMARYAPQKVFVTFTVPDEPYETYRQLRWREVTQQFIERGGAQAFIRLVRNHENRDGLWGWPESYFAHRAGVVNDAGLWLRRHGYDALGPTAFSPDSQCAPEIFYDLRADTVARQRAAGKISAVFFNETMRYLKSGPLGIFPIQTEQFMDWRVLAKAGTVDVYNLTDSRLRVRVRVRAAAPAGPKRVLGPEGEEFQFGGGQRQDWLMGPLELEPGANSIPLTDPRWSTEGRPLLISDVEVVPTPEQSP